MLKTINDPNLPATFKMTPEEIEESLKMGGILPCTQCGELAEYVTMLKIGNGKFCGDVCAKTYSDEYWRKIHEDRRKHGYVKWWLVDRRNKKHPT